MTDELRLLEVANATFVTERLLVGGDLRIYDEELAGRQLRELQEAGVTHLVDCRLEADDSEQVAQWAPEIAYHWQGIDDAGQQVPGEWFDEGVGWVLDALAADDDAIVLTHCHMGINRGPSLGYAVLLAQGWDPVDALDLIRSARPQAYIAYAEDALAWHHDRNGVSSDQRRDDRERITGWRRVNEIDLVRIIAEGRASGL